jgi:hypothetical protein
MQVNLIMKRLFFITAIAVLMFLYIDNQISVYKINRVELQSEKLQDQLRITQITDFHSNEYVDIDRIIDSVKEFDPHIIALTGDIIDFKTDNFNLAYRLIEMLNSLQKPVYFVKGNHEHGNPNFVDFMAGLENRGVIVLDGISVDVQIDDIQFTLYGSDFYSKADDYEKLFSGINKENLNIMLSHSPNRPIPYLPEGLDLILSGHTHGGQVRLPIVGGVLSPGEGFFPEYDKGIMEIGETILYIDSGLGNSVLPIRLFNRVQISEIIIE